MKRGFLTLTVIGCLLTGACSSGQAGKPEAGPIAETTEEGATSTMGYDFGEFPNVNVTGIDLAFLSDEELSVLYSQANAGKILPGNDRRRYRSHAGAGLGG